MGTDINTEFTEKNIKWLLNKKDNQPQNENSNNTKNIFYLSGRKFFFLKLTC